MSATIPVPPNHPVNASSQRETCPGCEKHIVLRKDGTFWHHRGHMPQWSGSPFKKLCPYSGLTPNGDVAGAE